MVLDRLHLQFTDGLTSNDDEGDSALSVLGEIVDLPGYLTGLKTDALAYGIDNRVVFIAAHGKVYMVDMVSRKLVYTLSLGN